MKFEVVAGGVAKEEEGNEDRESHAGNDESGKRKEGRRARIEYSFLGRGRSAQRDGSPQERVP